MGNITIACGPSFFSGRDKWTQVEVNGALSEKSTSRMPGVLPVCPLYGLLCGVRDGLNCSRRIECSSLCYTALSQLTRLYVCLKCRPIKCTYIYTQNMCVCMYVCMYVYTYSRIV